MQYPPPIKSKMPDGTKHIQKVYIVFAPGNLNKSKLKSIQQPVCLTEIRNSLNKIQYPTVKRYLFNCFYGHNYKYCFANTDKIHEYLTIKFDKNNNGGFIWLYTTTAIERFAKKSMETHT